MASELHIVRLAAVAILVTAACSSPPVDPPVDAADPPDMSPTPEMGRDMGDDAPDLATSDLGSDDVDVSFVGSDAASDAGDAGAVDVGPDMPECIPSGPPEVWTELPTMLSDTGLYDDIAAKSFATDVRSFEPKYALWSDGAAKTRWVSLPECAQIDTADPDHWGMPVGTRFWKQFDVGGVTVETRFIHRFGTGPEDFLFGAYLWAADGSDAVLVPSGAVDALGTTHDVPNQQACTSCHGRLPEKILGFSAIQLAHDGVGVTLDDLRAEWRFTDPLPTDIAVPGTDLERSAIGYFHGNCGNCHNGSPLGLELPRTPLDLRVSVHDAVVADTGVYRTAVDVDIVRFSHPGCSKRVEPGSASTSCVILRMQERARVEQMPPIGTEVIDSSGLQLVSDWIDSLAP